MRNYPLSDGLNWTVFQSTIMSWKSSFSWYFSKFPENITFRFVQFISYFSSYWSIHIPSPFDFYSHYGSIRPSHMNKAVISRKAQLRPFEIPIVFNHATLFHYEDVDKCINYRNTSFLIQQCSEIRPIFPAVVYPLGPIYVFLKTIHWGFKRY